ncbi:hypothetical protein GYMLUDRAFT_35943 [Collybiopsis luxurians FD-317 M1]|nr:hypothetical protein GYMLUDRAFT_35943 [Collybiopsis luxurians FD-317 M1]
MGVLGLTPFIQKTCPEVIKRLPNRLQGFSGKRVVLDGTLLTQRFHFAQIPHPYRHVLGWYRLIKELHDSGVEAICVFDGKERNLAKAQEASRRKNVQRLTAARASIENERLARLNQISKVVSNLSRLSSAAKTQVSDALAQLAFKPTVKAKGIQPSRSQAESRLWTSIPLSEAEEALRLESSVILADLIPEPPPFQDEQPPPRSATCLGDSELNHIIAQADVGSVGISDPSASFSESPNLETDNLMSRLGDLYREYQTSISRVISIPIHDARITSTTGSTVVSAAAEASVDSAQEAQEAFEMSKRQLQLSLQERGLWESLVSTLSSNEVDEILRELRELSHRSNVISESYRIRLKPPTVQTYAECKEILQAMGVSCIDTRGPFEAEALASSLVLNGYADYVASEDTDVLIYEAPLIRNITSRQLPLLVISGSELRSNLNLTRSMFIDFALLMGTDFSQRIRNVGPTRALDFIRAHGSIEKFIDAETKFKPKVPREEYLRQVNLGRNVFQTLPPVPEDAIQLRSSSKGDLGRVDFVMGKYGLSQEVDPAAEWDSEEALEGNYLDEDSEWSEKDQEGHW